MDNVLALLVATQKGCSALGCLEVAVPCAQDHTATVDVPCAFISETYLSSCLARHSYPTPPECPARRVASTGLVWLLLGRPMQPGMAAVLPLLLLPAAAVRSVP